MAPKKEMYDSTIHVLERARRGDHSAARILIERALPPLRRWSRGRLPGYARAGEDTEDVVQDAILGTFKRVKRFEHRTVGGLQAYLREAVVNRIRDLIRGSRRRGLKVPTGEDLRDTLPSPLERAIMRERLDEFLEALQRLRPVDRQVIVWRVNSGTPWTRLPSGWANQRRPRRWRCREPWLAWARKCKCGRVPTSSRAGSLPNQLRTECRRRAVNASPGSTWSEAPSWC